MQIQQEQNNNKGRFFVNIDGSDKAEMTYSLTPDKVMIIDHTEVDDSLRGKNVGLQMVTRAVEHAREQGLKIMPLCPFARSVFDKNPEFADVRK